MVGYRKCGERKNDYITIVSLVLGLPKMAAKSKYGLVFRDIRKLKAEYDCRNRKILVNFK